MTVQPYEGCWGVTQGGDKWGPMVPAEQSQAPIFHVRGLRLRWSKAGEVALCVGSSAAIVAVFATEAEADAYLAGEPAEAPKLPEVGSSFDFSRQDGTWLKVRVVPDAPKPVTWPDGVAEVHLDDGTAVCTANGGVGLRLPGQSNVSLENPRQLAALLKAAADYVEGRG